MILYLWFTNLLKIPYVRFACFQVDERPGASLKTQQPTNFQRAFSLSATNYIMVNQVDSSGFLAGGSNRYEDLHYNISQSSSWLSNLSRKHLLPLGITPKQSTILSILAAKYPESLSIQEVRKSLADKMSDASRLIDRLEKKGLLEKFPSDFDRRSNRARITEKGKELLDEVLRNRPDFEGAIADRLSDSEIDSLNKLLNRLK
ncbi:MarR family winged helix-turn-helix transcriptional regulator [Lewinella sp. 4G2]|uniref:MarR family winged helix-turn-helix transcriptional regulator n=1 Tax=Lewinella sp. 4G2 TaxID=1803372 RepID=UPI0007B4C6F5|nr:MarR family transcriptional regulator [Lewinella sp. 4G2]OAV42846.1 hypothetical protein A3850_016590 [Lewinella sp. 4G2]